MTQRTRPPARQGGRPGARAKPAAGARGSSGRTAGSRADGSRPGPRRTGSTVSATSAGKFAARQRARRWEGLRPLLTLLVLVLLGGAAGWVLYLSPWLTVRTIEVSGTAALSREAVLAAARIEPGIPLARLDQGAVRSRVEALPRVRLARVDRRWPRTVEVIVVERQPAAVVQVGRDYRLVDGTGVLFATVPSRPPAVPLIVAARPRPSAASLRAAIQVLGVLPPAVARRVGSVSAGSPDAIVLQLSGGVSVMWGSAEASERKAEVLTALMRLRAKVYDVSAPEAPTTRESLAPKAR